MRSLIRRFFLLFNYNHQRRQVDLQILWPACKENARDLEHARAAFAMHAFNDSAWTRLGGDEIARRIGALS